MQISEKDFEDWVCENLDEVLGTEPGKARLLGRQVKLPNGGILDVLAGTWSDRYGGQIELTVLELKAEVAQVAAVTQLLGYIGALRECVHAANMKRGGYNTSDLSIIVRGALVAPGLSAEAGWVFRGMNGHVDFVHLDVSIAATPWADIHPPVSSEDAKTKVADFLVSTAPTFWPSRDEPVAAEEGAAADDTRAE